VFAARNEATSSANEPNRSTSVYWKRWRSSAPPLRLVIESCTERSDDVPVVGLPNGAPTSVQRTCPSKRPCGSANCRLSESSWPSPSPSLATTELAVSAESGDSLPALPIRHQKLCSRTCATPSTVHGERPSAAAGSIVATATPSCSVIGSARAAPPENTPH